MKVSDLGVTEGCELPQEWWDLILRSVEEQSVLSVTELPLQHLFYILQTSDMYFTDKLLNIYRQHQNCVEFDLKTFSRDGEPGKL